MIMSIQNETAIAVEVYNTQLRSGRELATLMGVSRGYVTAMKREGFRLPGGKASLRMAQNFLSTCAEFKTCEEHPPEKPPTPAASSGTERGRALRNARCKP